MTHSATADVVAPETSESNIWVDRLNRFIVAAPDRLVLMFLWSAIVVAVTVMCGLFYKALVIPLAIVLIVATWKIRPSSLVASARSAIGSIVALEIVVAWIQLNRHYRGELVSIARDPGVYTIRAWWLMTHASPNMGVGGALAASRGIAGTSVAGGGLPYSHGALHPQGNSMVPGLLAVFGWVGHGGAMLQGNVVLGGLALLSVYAFGRRVLGPIWGLAPMVALAISMPMVYFARNTYTEPVALLVTFIGLTLMWSAWKTRSTLQFGAAGLAFGAAQLARIDGAVAVLGASIGIGLIAVLSVDTEVRARARKYLFAFAIGAGVMMALGTLDLIFNSPDYLVAQKKQVGELLVAFVVVVLVLLALSFVPVLTLVRTRLLTGRGGVAKFAGIVAAVGIVVMISRPYWFVGHFVRDAPIRLSITHYQKQEGLPIDGTRSYDEQTIHWLAWYIGWPAIVLAGAGIVWMLWYAIRTRRPHMVVFLATFGVVATLYLNDVNITPIQIWAMRRLLPVVEPSLLVLAVWFAVQLYRKFPQLRWLAVAFVVGIMALPAFSWNSLITTGEQTGELKEVDAICNAITGPKVLIVGDIPTSGYYLPSTRAICDKESLYVSTGDRTKLAEIDKQWGGGSITVISFNSAQIPWTASPTTPIHTGSYPYWPSLIKTRPGGPLYVSRTVWAGALQADGSVVPH